MFFVPCHMYKCKLPEIVRCGEGKFPDSPTSLYGDNKRKKNPLYHTIMTFENIVRKGENAGDQHFLLFPQCFLPFLIHISIFESHLFCHLQMLSVWAYPKFFSFGKELYAL